MAEACVVWLVHASPNTLFPFVPHLTSRTVGGFLALCPSTDVCGIVPVGLNVHFKKEADRRFTEARVWLSADEQYICWDDTIKQKDDGDKEPRFQGHKTIAVCDMESVEATRSPTFPSNVAAKGIIRIVLKDKPHAHASTSIDLVLQAADISNGTHRRWLAGIKKLMTIDHKPAMGLLRRLVCCVVIALMDQSTHDCAASVMP